MPPRIWVELQPNYSEHCLLSYRVHFQYFGCFFNLSPKKDKTKSRPKTAFLPVALFETLIRIPRLHQNQLI